MNRLYGSPPRKPLPSEPPKWRHSLDLHSNSATQVVRMRLYVCGPPVQTC